MSRALLVLSIGPVQEFIAAARRTRDLWMGSYLLSEISKAAARSVAGRGELIFPATRASSDLDKNSEFNVANLILASVSGRDARLIASEAHEAAKDRWRWFAEDARKWLPRNSSVIQVDLWDSQVDDVIEFYAAWTPYAADNYQDRRQRLMRLLAGRKNARDFRPAAGRAGVPKSSLDGARESVLVKGEGVKWPKGLRVRPGEQLDAVGLTKRMAMGHQSYPSVSRVAADAWLRGARKSAKGETSIEELKKVCQRLATDGNLHAIGPKYDPTGIFPYEGTAIYRERHHELWREVGASTGKESTNEVPPDFRELGEALGRLEKFAGTPDPYLAILVADGDRMGQAISRLGLIEEHQAFSRKLAGFAEEARAIVERHRGVLVYSGGDDVLAFVPVDQCLACARDLYAKFVSLMGEFAKDVPEERNLPKMTLSVGVAIGHFLEDLEVLLGYGRDAEKAAKGEDRDGLAVHLHKRGGAPIKVRRPWAGRPNARLMRWARLLKAEAIPDRIAYDLARMAETYRHWREDTVEEAIQADAIRTIRRKRPGGAEGQMDRIERLIALEVKDAASLKGLADELLVARQIERALKQAEGPKSPKTGPPNPEGPST